MDSMMISTYSRPKAAGFTNAAGYPVVSNFNTQPPEGGWIQV